MNASIEYNATIIYTDIHVLRGSNHLPREDTKTTPSPIARGPPMFRNFSLGAHMARADKPVGQKQSQSKYM